MGQRRRRAAISAASIAVLAAWLVFAAVTAQGYVRTKLELHDEGVWLTKGDEHSVGYLSKFSNRIEVRFAASQLDAPALTQAGTMLVLDDARGGKAMVVDARTAKPAVKLDNLPAGSVVAHRGGTVSLLDPVKGTVRIAEDAGASSLAGDGAVVFTAKADSNNQALQVVGVDGAVHVLSTLDGSVTTLRPGKPPKREGQVKSAIAAAVQLSAAGPTAVVLNPAEKTLSVPGHGSLRLGSIGQTLVLQQPGDDSGLVLVASETQLVGVPLGGGDVKHLAMDGTGGAIPPVRYRGSSYGAWGASRYAVRIDKTGKSTPYDRSNVASTTLRWQVGRNMVALNDASTGETLFLTDTGDVKKVEPQGWKDAATPPPPTPPPSTGSGTPSSPQACGASQDKPTPADDTEYGTRVGRPVIIPVLANDKDPNCGSVLVATKVADVQGGTAGVVADGTAVQFTPVGAQSGGFTYTVSDGHNIADARATVKVLAASGSENRPPTNQHGGKSAKQTGTLSGSVGAPVEGNVLRGWFDPEGDAFTLADQPTFEPAEAAGWFNVDPDGRLTGKPFNAGKVTASFRVIDEFGAASDGQVTIDVAQDAKVKAFPDTVFARPGETRVVDVLANDIGADLRIGKTTPPNAKVRAEGTDGNRKLSVRAEEPGEYLIRYEAKASGAPDKGAEGVLRLEVPKSGDGVKNEPPIAALDVALANAGVPVTVDVLHNDSDPNADVLVVTDATGDGSSEVQVIDHRFVRIQVSAFPPGGQSPVVRYTISDGTATAEGQIRVLKDPFGGIRQPVLRDDYRNVRAGSVIRIPVLENDSDPGSALHLATTNPVRPGRGDGQWVANGDEILFVAPAAEGRATATYQVEGSTTAQATVNVTVTRPDNQGNVTLERMPDVTVRAVSGQDVRVSLPLGADPDGDPLRLTGQFNPSTRPLGTVVASPTDLEAGIVVYRAEATKAGLDSFTYEVEEITSADRKRITGTVWVGVAAPAAAEAPVAYPDLVYFKAGEKRSIDVLRNDAPAARVELVRVDSPGGAQGFAEIDKLNPRLVSYQAPPGGAQTVTFTYQAGLKGITSTAKVTVKIEAAPPNLPPVVASGRVSLAIGASGSYPARERSYDPDARPGDILALDIDPSSKGTGARVDSGNIVVDRAAQSVTVLFAVTDPAGARTTGFVAFDVENPPPASSWKIPEPVDGDKPQVVDVRKFVTDDDGWTFKGASGEANGRIAKTEGDTVTFIPNPDTLNAQFIANVVDGKGRSAALTFGFKVLTNRPPAPLAVNLTVPSRGAHKQVTIDPNDADQADIGTHKILGSCVVTGPIAVSVTQPLTVDIGSDAGKGATGQVVCTVEDSRKKQGKAVVNVTVGGTDKPAPSAQPIQFDLEQGEKGGQPQTKDAVFTDPLGLGVTVRLPRSDARVALAATGTKITATPPASGFSGQLDLTYTVIDAEGREASAVLTVKVKGVPRAPSKPKVTAGDKTVTVEWSAPPPNGVPVDSYKVVSSGGQSKDNETGTSTTFSGLQNGTSYTFQVTACNTAWGCSLAPSVASDPAVPDSPPGTPQGFLAVREDKQVALTWQAPTDSGGTAISGYEIDCPACGRTQPIPAGQPSYTWTGLTNGTTYAFNLVAVKTLKSTGKLAKSDPSSQSAKPAGAPGAPPSVTATRDDTAKNGDVRVSWTASDPNGDPVTDYQVAVAGSGSSCAANVQGRTAVCTGLTKGTSVTVGVKAANHSGVGGAEVIGAERQSGPIVPAAKPGPPQISAIQGQGATATLTYSQPDDGGVNITAFKIYRNGTYLKNAATATSTTLDTPVGGSYTFTVDATNAAGYTSDQSSPSRSVKGQDVPTIAFTAAGAGGNTIRFTWNVATSNADNVSVQLSNVGGVGLSGTRDEDPGCGSSASHTLTVSYSWDGQAQPDQNRNANGSTPPCPSVCSAYTAYAQNVYMTPGPGAAIRANPDYTSTLKGSFGANAPFSVNGWTTGNTPYPANPSPYNSNQWLRLTDGRGWVSYAGARAAPTVQGQADNGPPVPLPPECRV